MQEAAFRACGLDWTYELWDVSPEGLAAAVERLHAHDMAGANVTIPHKVSVIDMLDSIEGEARAAGAVNTIRREGGRLVGSNTDVAGVRAALSEVGLGAPRGLRVVVLGAGGSARAVAVALEGADITFVARHPAGMPGEVLPWDGEGWRARARSSDLVVNATPAGREGGSPLRGEDLPSGGAVVDLVYRRGGTELVLAARSRGIPAADGWTVLAAQGAASFEAWTGRPAPLDVMRAALERAA